MFNLEKLDPRTKIIMVISISTGAVVVKNLWFLGGLLLGMVAIMVIGGVSLRKQFSQAKGILGIILFLFLLQWFLGSGLITGGMLSLRLLIIVVSALIVLTGKPRDYLLGMVQWKVPYEIAYMVIIGLHFFPILREEALDIYYSVQLRGTELKKTSLKKKLKAYTHMCLPILAGAMERAKDTSVAMEARCFRTYPYRTYLRRLKLKARDKAVMAIFPLAIALFTLVGCGVLSLNPIDLPDQIALSWSQDPTDSQTISWYGSEKYKGIIQVSQKSDQSKIQEFKANVTEVKEGEYYRYKGTATGLTSGTTYEYRVGDGKTLSKTSEFTTEVKGPFSFLYMGDIQYEVRDRDYKIWSNLLKSTYEKAPSLRFALLGGDMVDKGGDVKDWSEFFTAGQCVFSKIPAMTVPGNHETSVTPYTYSKMMAMPQNGPVRGEVYSFDYGNCHFEMVNSSLFMEERIKSMGKKDWSAMIKRVNGWIKKDLATTKAKWKIVTIHHPPYPVEEDDKIYSRIRNNWTHIFEDENVNVILSGHQHMYGRTKKINGVTYVIGNSGQKKTKYYKEGDPIPRYMEILKNTVGTYQIFRATEKTLSMKSYDSKGKKIDEIAWR
ncbi:MAG: CbiQ family ECF transporter T component [Anaerovoracaceae bacterium]